MPFAAFAQPVVTDDFALTQEDAAVLIDVLLNDSGYDPTTVVIATGPSNGSVLVDGTTGVVTYTPNGDFNGGDSFTYTVNDLGALTSLPATVTITVTPVNDVPSFNISALHTISEDASAQSVPGWASAISDGDPELDQGLNFNVTPVNGALFSIQPQISDDGTLTYTPAANANGTTVVNVTLTDDGSGVPPDVNTTATQNFTITITAVNDAPTFTISPSHNVGEDAGAQSINNWATSINDGDPGETQGLTFDVDAVNTGLFSVQPAISPAGTLTYTPLPNISGTTVVNVTLIDDGAGPGVNTSVPQNFTITINGENDAPSFTAGADQTDNEDAGPQTVNNWATAIDDGDPEEIQGLTFNVNALNSGLFSVQPSIDATTGTLTYTPAANANGSSQVNVTLTDDGAGPGVNTSPVQSFTINVTAINDAPVFTEGLDQNVIENAGPQSVSNWATSIGDGDPELTQNLTFNVTAVNAALFSTQPAISPTGTLTYTPALNANGSTTVDVTLSDDGAGPGVNTSAPQSFTITINSVNDPPFFTIGPNQNINEDAGAQSISNWATGIDDGDPGEVQNLTFNVNAVDNTLFSVLPFVSPTGTLTYTPAPNANGSTLVNISLSDDGLGMNTSPTQSFTISIAAINDVPFFTKGLDQNIIENAGPQSVPNWATSIGDGDPELAQNFTFNVTAVNAALFSTQPAISPTGTLTYTSALNANGSTTVNVTLSDDGAGPGVNTSAPQSFTITIDPVNDPPVFTIGPNQNINEDAGAQSISNWASGIDDGDPGEVQDLTFNVTAVNNALFSVLPFVSPTGTLTYTPAPNANGSTLVNISLTDDGLGTNTSPTQSFTISIAAINDVPVFTKGSDQTVDENGGPQSVSNWASGINDGDPDLVQNLTFNVTAVNPALFSAQPAISATGTLTFTPAANANGSTVVNVTLSDDGAGPGVNTSASQSFNININSINNAPSFIMGANQDVIEDAAAQSINNWATGINDGDPDVTQSLTFVVSAVNSTLFSVQPAISPTGTLTYTPAANASGSTLVNVTLTDDGSGIAPNVNSSATDDFTITIDPINDQPTISVIGDQTILEDTQTGDLAFTIGDLETAAASLAVTAVSSNTTLVPNANLVLGGSGSSRTINVTPVTDLSGTTNITVTVSDGVLMATRVFEVEVTSVNDPPTITDIIDQTIVEDTPTGALAFTVGDTETPVGSLTITRSSDNTTLVPIANIVIGGSGASRTVTITPAPNQTGSTVITLGVDDGSTTTEIDFMVSVTGVNDPPTISTITDRTINEDSQTGNINFTISDPETAAGALTVTGSSGNTTVIPDANIVLGGSGATRTVNVIPAADQFGVVIITLTVSDGVNPVATTFQVTVNPVNDVPLITNQVPITIDEVQPIVLSVNQLTILDADNVFPTDFTLYVTGGANYTITGTTTITPTLNFSGVLTVPVFVSDGPSFSPIYNLQVSVSSTNNAPVITDHVDLAMNEDASLLLEVTNLTVTDPDNDFPDDFTLTVMQGTDYTVNANTITPVLNFNGTLTVVVKVNDGLVDSPPFNVEVTVNPVNDPPVITAQSNLSLNEDTQITLLIGNFTVTDPEPTTYTLSVSQTPGPNYTVSGNTITPNPHYFGMITVPVTVSDGFLNSVAFNAQIQVVPVNDPPAIAGHVPLETVEDIPITLQFSDLTVTDIDNSYPTGFTINLQAGTHYTFSGTTVTPDLDYVGPIYVSVSVYDGAASSPPVLVLITVTDDADAPIITGQNPVSLNEDDSRLIVLADVIVEDPDTPADQLTLTVLPGTNYSVEGNTITPNAHYYGTLSVNVTVTDGIATSNTFPLQVTVISVNDPPVFNAISNITVLEDAAQQSIIITGISPGPLEITQQLLLTALSDNTELIPNPVQTPTYNGTSSSATIAFKPAPNMFGTATITVRVVDNDFTEFVRTFTITVTSVNDAPTLNTITYGPIIEDAPEQVVTLTGVSPGGGTAEANQTLTFIPSTDKIELFDLLEVDYTASQSTASLRIIPKPNANGTAQITIRVQDNGPGTPAPNVNFITRTFPLVIQPVNDLPVFLSTADNTAEPGNLYEYFVDVVDVDGEAITLSAPTKPAWLTFTLGTNGKATLSGTPPPAATGDVEVLLEARDPSGEVVEQLFTITVNSRPVLSPVTITIDEDIVLQFNADIFADGFNDPDGNTLAEVEITELPSRGVLRLNGNNVAVGAKIAVADLTNLTYTPMQDSTGADTFRWNASDGFMLYSLSDTFTQINVLPVNDAPVITVIEPEQSDTLKYELGSEIPIQLTAIFDAKDADKDNLVGAEIGFRRIDNYRFSEENDHLFFENTPKITGQYDGGILTLTGQATVNEYVEAIRSIKYNYDNVTDLAAETGSFRSVYFTLSDGKSNSLQRARLITLVYTFVDLQIPTAFTPNVDDNVNRTWKISSVKGTEQYSDAEIKIYNKRGLLLYETKGFEQPWNGIWNGEILPSDTYFYTIDLNYNKVRYKGTVTLLR